ncbi:MAG: DUF1080 domain-containing protein, partial [Planctomycetaceae bacterium]
MPVHLLPRAASAQAANSAGSRCCHIRTRAGDCWNFPVTTMWNCQPIRCSCVLAWLCASIGGLASADETIAGVPVARPEGTLRPEFHGEYVGYLTSPAGCLARTGLQIVPLGEGRFQAVEFRGGLPGNRGELKPAIPSTGEIQAGLAVLSGDDRVYSSNGWQVTVTDAAGRPLGTLGRVRRASRFLGACPPQCGIVLFNGRETSELHNTRITADGLLQVGCETTRSYRDFLLHVEFRTPLMPAARGQARGNSGVYLQGRYEVQILDSFG